MTRRLASLALVLLIALTLLSPNIAAQNSVSGKVTSVGGEPLRANVSTVANNRIIKTVTALEDGSWTLPLDQGVSKILFYLDDASTPGYDYVPALISISDGSMDVALFPAASLHMQGYLLFVDTDNIPVSYNYQITSLNGTLLSPSGYPLVFGSKTTNLIPIPNLPTSMVIVPAGVEYRIWIGASILVGTKVTTKATYSIPQQPLKARTLTEFPVMGVTLEYNLDLVGTVISDASTKILSMEGQGFYLVREKGILARAVAGYEAAQQRYEEGDFNAGFDSAKRSFIDARSTLGDLSNLALDAASGVYIIIAFLALASVTTGFLLVDSTRLQIVLGALVYAASLLLLREVYPGVETTPLQELLLISAASFIVVVGGAVFLPKLMSDRGENGRISVGSILIPILSIAKRSLKRRKLRFALTLVSLTVLVMSFVSLTSLSEGYGLMIVRSTTLTPHEGLLIRASTWTLTEPTFMEFVESEVDWILGHTEVVGVSVKIENLPQQLPLTSISGNKIYSIMGVNVANESVIIPLGSALVSGILPGPGEVALSVSLAARLGIKLGDVVRLRDRVLTLSGLLDDAAFSSLTDLDGTAYIPDKWVNLSPPGEPAYWERQATLASEAALVDYSTARLTRSLGVTRIALEMGEERDTFAEKLALQRGYLTWSASGTSVVFTALGSYLEGKGLPLVIPWAIVVLNVVVTMLNSLFERRREISILSSVGLNPAEISSIFVAEASITGFIAGGLGYLAGLSLYTLMPSLGLALEVHQKVSAIWTLAAICISISAVLVGAFASLRSSIVITPSLTRKWKMVEGQGGFNTPWIIPVPVKMETEDVESYVNYLLSRLRALENDQVRLTARVAVENRGDVKVISFIYKSYQATTGNFYTRNSVYIEPSDGVYLVRLESAGGEDWAHETGTLIRLITMEWSNRSR